MLSTTYLCNEGSRVHCCFLLFHGLEQRGYTVHSRYLGSRKPLGGLYHYINIGSFFLMLLDEYSIKLYT